MQDTLFVDDIEIKFINDCIDLKASFKEATEEQKKWFFEISSVKKMSEELQKNPSDYGLYKMNEQFILSMPPSCKKFYKSMWDVERPVLLLRRTNDAKWIQTGKLYRL